MDEERLIEIALRRLDQLLAQSVDMIVEADLLSPEAWKQALVCPGGMIHDAASRMRCASVYIGLGMVLLRFAQAGRVVVLAAGKRGRPSVGGVNRRRPDAGRSGRRLKSGATHFCSASHLILENPLEQCYLAVQDDIAHIAHVRQPFIEHALHVGPDAGSECSTGRAHPHGGDQRLVQRRANLRK